MSFTSWLNSLTFARAPEGKHHLRRRHAHHGAIHRLHLETLEDRRLLAFSPAASFPVGPNPQAMVAGDFNNDGHLDLATANSDDGTVSVLLGDGHGGFGAAIDSSPSASYPRVSLAVADFNNDGNLDLAMSPLYDGLGSRGVLLGNGDGTFQAPVTRRTTRPCSGGGGGLQQRRQQRPRGLRE